MIAFCGCEGVGSPKVEKGVKVCGIDRGGCCSVYPWMGFVELDFLECKGVFAAAAGDGMVDVGSVVDVCESILG